MSDKIEDKLHVWNDSSARETNRRLVHLEKRLYQTYEPAHPPEPNFRSRLENWLDNVSPDYKNERALFNSITDLFYVGPVEFRELYRSAYNGPIARWLIDDAGIMLDDPDADKKLEAAVLETWFCPISDSMRINSFYHVNNVSSGWDYRPDWRSLEKFGSLKKIKDYCSGNIKRLVILEDFVGGGSQMQDAIEFASHLKSELSILVVPLIICPKGDKVAKSLEAMLGIKYSPVLVLDERSFVYDYGKNDEKESIKLIKKLAFHTYSKVADGVPPFTKDIHGDFKKPYHPLGWNKTGGLVVMYSNTPDNTLPLYHWKSSQWCPLFPRHSRV